MKLTDIMPLEKWVELEKEINRQFGINASAVDINGTKITDYDARANKLCPLIRKTERGITFICATAHQNFAAQAIQTKQPVVGECDAGLAKVVAPIFVGEEYVGAIGGCGLLLQDGEVESFMIHKAADVDEGEIEKISNGIKRISDNDTESLVQFLVERIETVVSDL